MAKLRVAPHLLLQVLFPDQIGLEIHGASFENFHGAIAVVLDIEGPDVPDAQEVIAEIRVERRTTTFKPIG